MSRTVFFGTSDFAATVLSRLSESAHRPQLVVTPPDSRRGRGRHEQPPPAASVAQELDLPLVQVQSINSDDALERIRSSSPDAAVVCAFGQLIREPLLSELPMLNVHPSLLPRWRGAAPIERAIMAGDPQTGVCVMRLTEGLDSGPVALCERTAIEPGEDFGSLASRLAALGGDLIVRALDLDRQGKLEFREQDEAQANYADKIEPSERRLDPKLPASQLERVVRALSPHVGTYLELAEGERLGVRAATAEDEAAELGTLQAWDGRLVLGCGEGALILAVVQPAGGRPMPADAFVRGHQVPDRVIVQNEGRHG